MLKPHGIDVVLDRVTRELMVLWTECQYLSFQMRDSDTVALEGTLSFRPTERVRLGEASIRLSAKK
jgi:hypothetical protein